MTYPPESIRRRLGWFSVSVEFMPDACRRLFSDFVVLRCSRNFARETFEFVALSELFDELTPIDDTPEYEILITEKPDGSPPTISASRRNK